MQSNDLGAGAINSGVAILDSPNCVCECGHKVFRERMVLKRISQLISPSGREELYPIPIFVCDKCGKILSEPMGADNAAKLLGETTKKEESTLIFK